MQKHRNTWFILADGAKARILQRRASEPRSFTVIDHEESAEALCPAMNSPPTVPAAAMKAPTRPGTRSSGRPTRMRPRRAILNKRLPIWSTGRRNRVCSSAGAGGSSTGIG